MLTGPIEYVKDCDGLNTKPLTVVIAAVEVWKAMKIVLDTDGFLKTMVWQLSGIAVLTTTAVPAVVTVWVKLSSGSSERAITSP